GVVDGLFHDRALAHALVDDPRGHLALAETGNVDLRGDVGVRVVHARLQFVQRHLNGQFRPCGLEILDGALHYVLSTRAVGWAGRGRPALLVWKMPAGTREGIRIQTVLSIVPSWPQRYDGKHCLYAYAFSRACRHLPDQQRGSPATRPSNRTSGEHVVKSAVENLEPTRAKLTVEVPLDELQPSVDHAYSHIASQINVPGFRKGKVPPRIIDQRVGKGAVMEQAINDA